MKEIVLLGVTIKRAVDIFGNDWTDFFGNGEAMTQLPDLKCRHLTRSTSDHSPLLLTIAERPKHKSRFIFQNMWMEHYNFLPLVNSVWNERVEGSPSFRVEEKLRRFQRKLKTWN